MGIISEAAAARTAEQIERVLAKALETKNQDVYMFCQEHLIPVYVDQVLESFGAYKVPDSIREGFEEISQKHLHGVR